MNNSTTDVWQDYLSKQLLIPMLNYETFEAKMIIASAHHIKEYNHEKFDEIYKIIIKLNDGRTCYFPTICQSLEQVFECKNIISSIFVGELEVSLNEWLAIYPKYELNFELLEWRQNNG